MGSLYVFDLDGTLARNEWRSFLIKQDPPDWYEYHEASSPKPVSYTHLTLPTNREV